MVAFIADYLITNQLRKSQVISRGEIEVWNDILSGKVNSDAIILGSSRAWVNFNPTIITSKTQISCYNIGIDGHPFLMQYYRYNILKKFNKTPKLLIISLDVNSLTRRPDLYNSDQFLPFLLTNRIDFEEPLLKFKGFNNYDFELPLVRYYGNSFVLLEMLKNYNNNETGRVKGFKGQNKKWNNDLKNAKLKHNSIRVEVDHFTLNLFHEFIKNCKREGTNIVFVYSPEYIEGQKFINNRERIISLYKEIGREYNIPFINFSSDDLSLNKKYFYNSAHLNNEGADLFTEKLIVKLKVGNIVPQ